MELKEFIKETLIQISDGINEGNKYIIANYKTTGVDSGYKRVKFDIALTTTELDKTDGGGKITVAGILSLGASGESTVQSSNVSRIEFEVLVDLNKSDAKFVV